MFLRKHIKLISFVLLFNIFAWYSQRYLGEVSEGILVQTWNCTFKRFNAACIYWMTLRLPIWILIYLQLLHLENKFSVYLFIRQGNYRKIFICVYIKCICIVACYFAVGTIIMAVYHSVLILGMNVLDILFYDEVMQILVEEGLECLSCCLLAYIIHCGIKKAEVGFLIVLVGRLLFNFATDGIRQGLPIQMIANLLLVFAVFYIAFRDFSEKYLDE